MCRDHTRRSDAGAIYKPGECPFTIRQLNASTWLVRENDRYGEFPHIYVKKVHQDGAEVLVITDTGVGTEVPRHIPEDEMRKKEEEVKRWNIATFISHHLNPTFSIPYLVILSHCHYDHILGLVPFLSQLSKPGHVQILASNHDREFLEPYETLEEHSLCNSEKITCPTYAVSIWARHGENVVYSHPLGPSIVLPIKTLWTPGHTPDSLSWFDEQERVVYVGDSLYTRTSSDAENAPWGPESAAPILFPKEGDIELWWESVDKVLAFVQARNEHGKEGKRVMLSAGHVTTNVDAETVLKEVKAFMGRVLNDKVDFEERGMKRGERFGMWVEDGGRFSLGAPVRVVEQGRGKIPRDKWTLE